MTERMRNIIVGLTGVVGLVGFAVLILLFGYVPAYLEGGYELRIELAESHGLSEGSRVKLRGQDVGRVESVSLADPPTHVIAALRIRDDVNIPVGVAAVVPQQLLLAGNPIVQLDVTHLTIDQATAYLPKDGSAPVLRAEASGSMLGTMARQLSATLEAPMQKIDKLADSIDLLSQEWTRVAQNINALTEPRTTEQVEAGEAMGNLTTVLARADTRLAELNEVVVGLNTIVNDPQLREHIKTTAANTAKLTGNLNDATAEARALMDDAGQKFDQLATRYVALADDMSGLVGGLNDAVHRAREGDGTVAKLLNESQLYDNLNDSVRRMSEAIDEFRLLVAKWKQEGLPVQF